jgi:hypothetical protein
VDEIYIVFFILTVVSFGFAGYFLYLTKGKKLIIKRSERDENNKVNFSIGIDDQGFSSLDSKKGIKLEGYKVSDMVKTINSFTDSFNKGNKRVNAASAIISVIAGIGYLISAILMPS